MNKDIAFCPYCGNPDYPRTWYDREVFEDSFEWRGDYCDRCFQYYRLNYCPVIGFYTSTEESYLSAITNRMNLDISSEQLEEVIDHCEDNYETHLTFLSWRGDT